jgi:hypothetical protein
MMWKWFVGCLPRWRAVIWPLRPDEYVISADEKTYIQARIRKHATTPPAPHQPARVEAEYFRAGALAYMSAWDVHRAKVLGRCEATTGIDPFDRLVDQVMTTEPYASAHRVFWVVDNGSSHRGQVSIDRLQACWPTLRLIHVPGTHPGSTWKSTSPSCNVKSSLQTTSTPSTRSSHACTTSSSTTNRSPRRSNGSSPRTI